ncbi:ImmA/IrrE family metallo-endopeptidase [Mycobacteroides abscessus subsp. massiliense]|uniref:ImmA/IrrE family metallo-endopeptidase n=1 Tax=Mycobacteroides abscessus TaxID=36809 RepID=UPI0019D30D1D|nr:ImmA/IrrE family metallo-endopeptidase [Mycobacteroides abscessus]MBN7315805.1 ImmA/IrrE family metallo-endopeptidase [Mycobacteroides abscessus subsp. massiliense]
MATVEVFGTRVRQARVLRRMSGTAVMEYMGWRSPRQTRLEQAETSELEWSELTRLAGMLRFPPRFFITAPVSRVSAQDLLFRAPKSTTVSEKEYLAVFANVAGDLFDELNKQVKLPAVQLEPVPVGTDIVTAAAKARGWLGLEPHTPLRYLTYDLESAGVPVILRMRHSRSSGRVEWDNDGEYEPAGQLTEKHLGCSARTGEFRERPLVLVRGMDSWERTRWTIAHEIGHIVLHRYGGVSDDEEREASRFASEFLAPAAVIADELPPTPTLNNLIPLKLRWGISLGALIMHLRESKLVGPERADTLQRQLYTRINTETGSTWGKTEPGWDARKPERPRLLLKWIEACYGATSAVELAAHNLIFPTDLLSDFLAGQRGAPPKPTPAQSHSEPAQLVKSGAGSGVIDLDRARSFRQA